MKALLSRDYVLMLSCSLLLTLVMVLMGRLSLSIKGGVLFEGLVLVLGVEREMNSRYQVAMLDPSSIKKWRCCLRVGVSVWTRRTSRNFKPNRYVLATSHQPRRARGHLRALGQEREPSVRCKSCRSKVVIAEI